MKMVAIGPHERREILAARMACASHDRREIRGVDQYF
jgi:hypothetical protein